MCYDFRNPARARSSQMGESNWGLNGYKIECDVTKIVGDVDDGGVGFEMLIKDFCIQIQIFKFQSGTRPTLEVRIFNRKLICCLFVVLIAVNNAGYNVCVYVCICTPHPILCG